MTDFTRLYCEKHVDPEARKQTLETNPWYQCQACEAVMHDQMLQSRRLEAEEIGRQADNHQRREYAKAALVALLTTPASTSTFRLCMESGMSDSQKFASLAFDYADAMLAEQRGRESR